MSQIWYATRRSPVELFVLNGNILCPSVHVSFTCTSKVDNYDHFAQIELWYQILRHVSKEKVNKMVHGVI